jgi:hypothetical protein
LTLLDLRAGVAQRAALDQRRSLTMAVVRERMIIRRCASVMRNLYSVLGGVIEFAAA